MTQAPCLSRGGEAPRLRTIAGVALFLALLLFRPVVQAQAMNDYDLSWFVIAGGGGTSTGADATGAVYTVSGTIGQWDTGTASGSNYTVLGGFWSVVAPSLIVIVPPSITQQPSSLVVTQGASATFTVVASGTPPLSYQWRLDGTNLASATSASYTVITTQPGAHTYSVVVSNAAGSVTSVMATLTVSLEGELVLSPANGPVGRAVSVSVVGLSSFLAGQTMLISFDGNLVATQTLVACDQQVGGAGFGLMCDGGPVSVVVPAVANGPHGFAASTGVGNPGLQATFTVGQDFEAATFAGQTAPGFEVNGTNIFVDFPAPGEPNDEVVPPVPPGRFVPRRNSPARAVAGANAANQLAPPPAVKGPPSDPLKIIKNSSLGSLLLNGSGDPPDVSLASSGKVVFYAFNNTWGAFSTDSGNTFQLIEARALSPTTKPDGSKIDGGMCCDQIVVYVPTIDRFIWMTQFWPAGPSPANTNRYRFAVASPADIIASKGIKWRFFDLTSRDLGLDGWMDYPGLAVGASFLYLTANAVTVPGKSVIVRIPLTDFIETGTPRLNFRAFASSAGEFRLVQNCGYRQFWANRKDQSTMRIYYWDEINEPDKVMWNDYTTPTSFEPNFDSPAPNNANWLSFGGPPSGNLSSGTLAGNELWLAWNAGPDPETVPAGSRITQPRIDLVRFHAVTFGLLEYRPLWYTDYAYAYGYLASTSDGEVGLSFAWGGNHAYWPNHAVGFLTGNSELVNTTASTWSAERFGDYLSLRRHHPDGRLLAAAGYATWVRGVPGIPYTYDPHYVLFGRSSVPVPICLVVRGIADGKIRFDIVGERGSSFKLQGSADLTQWTDLLQTVFQSDTYSFTDEQSSSLPYRFYRAVVPGQ